jgi:hypothetical protein
VAGRLRNAKDRGFPGVFAFYRMAHSIRMVNDRFPRRRAYGFEMVDAPCASLRPAKARINRKFTPNQISRIFRSFSSN